MNLARFIPNKATQLVGRQILQAQKHSPTVLFAGGVVGVVATVVLASRATLKLDQVLEDTQKQLIDIGQVEHEQYSEQDRSRDKVVVYVQTGLTIAKLYAPAVLIGVSSIAALTGSHVVLTRRNAALTAAYAAVEKGFAEYRSRVVSEFGEDKDRELRYGYETREFVKESKNGPEVTSHKRVSGNTPSVYARFFDQFSKSWSQEPEYNLMFLRCQQTYANDLLHSRGHVFLNEIYDMLGIDRTKAGAVVGWIINDDGSGDNHIDFGIFDGDNPRARDFVNGREGSILLDFNVDGVIYDKI